MTRLRNVLTTVSTVMLLLWILAAPAASTTLYVNGANGSDSNNCTSATTACKTLRHAILLSASGDSIRVAAATYRENLTVAISLTLIGAGRNITAIDGGAVGRVVSVSSSAARVVLSGFALRNGLVQGLVVYGGGIINTGKLTINYCTIANNYARGQDGSSGGGVSNTGTLRINNSTISGNSSGAGVSAGGGIYNRGTLVINKSTVAGNGSVLGGGLYNQFQGIVAISNSTFSGNTGYQGAAIGNAGGTIVIRNSTLSGNGAVRGGIYSATNTTLANSIVANSGSGGNCYMVSGISSDGYNLSSDGTCNFNGPGDMNQVDPLLGPLRINGGPTQTMALTSGSPANDAGNPGGCTDSSGHLLKTDQRGRPRPDAEDTGGCDIGAYERQSD